MSRRICVDLYNALIKLRPEWAEETLKVVMTGSAEDGPEWQKHIRSKDARRKLAIDSRDLAPGSFFGSPLRVEIPRLPYFQHHSDLAPAPRGG